MVFQISEHTLSEFTAHLRGDEVKKTWIKRLPQEIRCNSLLFQGAPDLIIKSCEPDKSEGMVFVSQNEGFDEDTVEDSENLPSSQDSAESARIQIAHQMTNLKPYRKGSFLFEKVGELVVALLNMLAYKAFRKYMMEKEVKSFVANGLYPQVSSHFSCQRYYAPQ